MSHKSNKKHHPYCLNCHYPLSEFDKNCSQCGQKPTDGKITLHDLMHEFVHTLFHLDGKFFWTLKHLFVPGKLTTEFFKGHHKRYAHPVQLFLVLGALTFGTIISKTHEAEEVILKSVEKNKRIVQRENYLEELKRAHLAVAPQYSKEQSRILDTVFVKFKNGEFDEEKKRENKETVERNRKKEERKRAEDEGKIVKTKNNDIVINFSSGDDEDDKKMKAASKSDLNNDPLQRLKKDSVSINNSEKTGFVNGFQDGIQEGWNIAEAEKNEKTEKAKKDEEEAKRINGILTNDPYYIQKDSSLLSTRISFDKVLRDKRKIPDSELYSLSADSLIKKYNIVGFWSQLYGKQNIKLRQNGDSLFHNFMTRLLWITLALIPILALVFLLMYRRQKRYYVEHIVFLLHFNTTIFAGLIPTLFIFPYWHDIVTVFLLWSVIHFFMALKNYYQQGKRKTFLKFFIIFNAYWFLAMFVITIGLILSFLLF